MKKEIKEVIILGSILLVLFICSFFIMANHKGNIKALASEDIGSEAAADKEVGNEEAIDIVDIATIKEAEKVDSVTGLLVGLDASGGLTDVLMVCNFNTETNEMKIVSVPRDLEINFRKEPFKTIKQNANEAGVSKYGDDFKKLAVSSCKVNSIYYNFYKTKESFGVVQEVVEEITGLDIDYMAVIDTSGFKEVVDAIGGVDFYVPQRMYYVDRMQDLYIDLQEGQQLLDGDQAMQLVRFRHYPMGDIQRISVQQDFIVELYKKVRLIRDFDQISELATSVYNLFDSDFGVTVALEYVQYIFELDTKNLLNDENMVTIPSWGEKIDEKWYQYWDEEEARTVVEELMNK